METKEKQKLDLIPTLQQQEEQAAIAQLPQLSQLQISSREAALAAAIARQMMAYQQPMVMPSYGQQDRLALYMVGGLAGSLVFMLFFALIVNIISAPKANQLVDSQMRIIEQQNEVIREMKTAPVQDNCVFMCGG